MQNEPKLDQKLVQEAILSQQATNEADAKYFTDQPVEKSEMKESGKKPNLEKSNESSGPIEIICNEEIKSRPRSATRYSNQGQNLNEIANENMGESKRSL